MARSGKGPYSPDCSAVTVVCVYRTDTSKPIYPRAPHHNLDKLRGYKGFRNFAGDSCRRLYPSTLMQVARLQPG
jgi:hypothetical protein